MNFFDNLLVRRIVAFYIDFFIAAPIIILSIIISLIFGWAFKLNLSTFWGSDKLFWDFSRALYVSVYLSIFYSVLDYRFKGTIGKRAMGLKVQSNNNVKVAFYQHLIRNYIKLFDFVLIVFSLPLLFNKGTRRLGDYLARTKVIRLSQSDIT